MLGVSGDDLQSFCRGLEEDAVDHLLVLISDGGNLFRYGEDHVKAPARPPGSPAPMMYNWTPSIGPPAIRARNIMATTVRAITFIPTAFWRSTPGPANSSGTTKPRRTICGIGMPPRHPW